MSFKSMGDFVAAAEKLGDLKIVHSAGRGENKFKVQCSKFNVCPERSEGSFLAS
jgi:hypothetical protein